LVLKTKKKSTTPIKEGFHLHTVGLGIYTPFLALNPVSTNPSPVPQTHYYLFTTVTGGGGPYQAFSSKPREPGNIFQELEGTRFSKC